MRLLLLAEEEAIARSGKCGSKQEARPADVRVPAREALGELQQQQQQQQQPLPALDLALLPVPRFICMLQDTRPRWPRYVRR
jgi:hypothetical protein